MKRRLCWSVDAQIYDRFQGVCVRAGLPRSHVINELMDYFVRLEGQAVQSGALATIPVEQDTQQETRP